MSSNTASLAAVTAQPETASNQRVNYLGVVGAAVAAFVASGLWYSPLVLGTLYAQLRAADPGAMTPTEILIEFIRTLVVAYAFARLVALVGVRDWRAALRFGLWVWIGFPTMILLGSVAHENVPLPLAAIHAGDWLVKVLILTLVPGLWRR
jgi:Protein of unknown function (DUF1761)